MSVFSVQSSSKTSLNFDAENKELSADSAKIRKQYSIMTQWTYSVNGDVEHGEDRNYSLELSTRHITKRQEEYFTQKEDRIQLSCNHFFFLELAQDDEFLSQFYNKKIWCIWGENLVECVEGASARRNFHEQRFYTPRMDEFSKPLKGICYFIIFSEYASLRSKNMQLLPSKQEKEIFSNKLINASDGDYFSENLYLGDLSFKYNSTTYALPVKGEARENYEDELHELAFYDGNIYCMDLTLLSSFVRINAGNIGLSVENTWLVSKLYFHKDRPQLRFFIPKQFAKSQSISFELKIGTILLKAKSYLEKGKNQKKQRKLEASLENKEENTTEKANLSSNEKKRKIEELLTAPEIVFFSE